MHARTIVRTLILGLVCLLGGVMGREAAGQTCGPGWLPQRAGGGVTSMGGDRTVFGSAAWDPDGSGPLPKHLVAVGYFTIAGSQMVPHVAEWDGNAWLSIGDASTDHDVDEVSAVAVLANGNLVVGGDFQSIAGHSARGIAQWNRAASHWDQLGPDGIAGEDAVRVLLALPSGDSDGLLIAGGNFTSIGSTGPVTVHNIARWTGSAWLALGPSGQGLTTPGGGAETVFALTVMANGDIIAGGTFTVAHNVGPSEDITVNHVARWKHSTGKWEAIDGGMNDDVTALIATSSGDILAGGDFTVTQSSTGGNVTATHIARWNHSTSHWEAMGAGLSVPVRALAIMSDGSPVAGTGEGQPDLSATHVGGPVARWDAASSTWVNLGSGMDHETYTLTVMPNGDLFAGGDFMHADGNFARRIAQWNGTTWHEPGSQTNESVDGPVAAMAVLRDGTLAVGGEFKVAGTIEPGQIARWNGAAWSKFATVGIVPPSNTMAFVSALASIPSTSMMDPVQFVAAGTFTNIGGTAVRNIAKWTGTAWSPLDDGTSADGTDAPVAALCMWTASNRIVAGGSFLVTLQPNTTNPRKSSCSGRNRRVGCTRAAPILIRKRLFCTRLKSYAF